MHFNCNGNSYAITWWEGAATRTARHLDLMAGITWSQRQLYIDVLQEDNLQSANIITLLVELVTKMTRQVAMCFSMVRLKAL